MKEQKINIAEILKGLPEGTELYSPAYGYVEFSGFCSGYICVTFGCHTYSFNEYGEINKGGEVMLFPSKDQRDWSKFAKPVVKPFNIKRVKRNKDYFLINPLGIVEEENECFTPSDDETFEFGNYFNTKEQAKYAAEKVRELLLSLRK